MLGKTNIIYVTKDQSSDMQFVAEAIITRSSSNIVKMKYFNGMFFAFTDENHVLYGKNMMELNFLQKDGKPFNATDMECFDGKYVFINADEDYGNSNKEIPFYVSSVDSCTVFEEYKMQLGGSLLAKIVGIAINSYNQLVFLVLTFQDYSESRTDGFYVFNGRINVVECGSLTGETVYKRQGCEIKNNVGKYCSRSVFMRDRFFFYSNGSEGGDKKEYYNCITLDAVVKEISGGCFPIGVIGNMAYVSIGENTYYTLNFENYVKLRPLPTDYCFPIKGRIGFCNGGVLELGATVSDFTAGRSTAIEIIGIDYEVLCFIEAGEYTYLGCQGGVIIQCFLDIDGIYQLPEITLVKSLAAQEALTLAKEYTDNRFEILKKYVDGKLP